MDAKILKNYATLLVKKGVNLQKGQKLVIQSDVANANFVSLITEIAYEVGACEVVVDWSCEEVTRLRFLNADSDVFNHTPESRIKFFEENDDKNACYLFVESDDPYLLKGVDPEKIKAQNLSKGKALEKHRKLTMSNQRRWSIGSVPSIKWALQVFPNKTEEAAVAKLWDYILKASYSDGKDPVKTWAEHVSMSNKRAEYMNSRKFRYLKYKNSLGTDLTIEFPKEYLWVAVGEKAADDIEFSANIPSEEIFTLPKKNGVNGKVVASMPLCRDGVIIENFEIEFKDGKVVSFKADKNEDVLRGIIELDEGSHFLGEVALVPYSSPISQMKTLFFNTLFDENASCHLALGDSYASCLENFQTLTKQDLKEIGANESITHVDFMIGTEDLSIKGTDWDGKEEPIFVNGNFAF